MSSLVYSLRWRLSRIEPEKLWTYILTTILVLLIYFLVMQITLEEPRFDVEKFAEIDFSKYLPPKQKSAEPTKKPMDKTPKEISPELPSPSTVAPDVIPEIDLSALKDLGNPARPSELSPLQRVATLPQAMQMPDINVGTIIKPPDNAPVVRSQPGGLPVYGTPSNVYNPNLATTKAGYGGVPGARRYSPGTINPVLSGRPAVDATPKKVVVKKFGEADLKKDLRELFRKLLKWLREHPYEFPPALQYYMRYKEGDATSKTEVDTGPTTYELFMLCNEDSEDFGILLVAKGDSAQAIWLRDNGFRKQSFSLNKGVAGRRDGEVASLSMLEKTPTKEETSRFYSIFLSWWEGIEKAEGQKKP
ncbi:MAG: hypothetical protein ONB44_23735 [candidate division KSB1 bacterium]|nr:hypothetical protein [candidate division KSB1 bacterium]MDZ7305155.1 hypothetical protein [candidate division KSB1 bacterium]MDZ7314239.1 hypothetical protein [candidate division KSB1 bacterium]